MQIHTHMYVPTILISSSVHSLLSAACCPISASMAKLAITLWSYGEKRGKKQMLTGRDSMTELTQTLHTYVHTYVRRYKDVRHGLCLTVMLYVHTYVHI